MYGYTGQLLRIDLSSGTCRSEPLPDELVQHYVGGRGFVARILYSEVPAGTDAFSPDNRVVIATGPLSGMPMPSTGKVEFGAKSPATGGYGDSNMGGQFGPEIKQAGYDAVIIQGRAPHPVVVIIDDAEVKLLDGRKYWGMGSIDAEVALKNDIGEDFEVAVIGPAGEHLVRFACVSHDLGRQAGRTGIGAVLGSKNVKAICVRGTRGITVADPEGVRQKGKEMFDKVAAMPGFVTWTPFGTALLTEWVNTVGVFPTNNFRSGYFPGYRRIGGWAVHQRKVLDKGCYACPIPCGKVVSASWGGRKALVEGPEYETIALVGGNLMLDRLDEVAWANYVLDQLGLDTISCGNVIGFALECFERGIISETHTEGRKLSFGDLESVLYVAEKIAARDGIGAVLADGVARSAAELGQGSEDFAIHVKGLELSGYEPRYMAGMMLAYMTCDVGAHHNRAWLVSHDIAVGREVIEGKAAKVVELQNFRSLFDMLGLCRFPWIEIGFDFSNYLEGLEPVTGVRRSLEDLLLVSERVWNLTRMFNVREIPGFGRKFDYPPRRLYTEGAASGPTEGLHLTKEEVERLLDDYYRLRGWSAEGIPTAETLRRLGVDFCLDS